ncbi:MAG: LPS export ABC transporter periplasmic protein LptC [Candidatus Competibacteraceae bacterium]|nr:LPS export ABC transporter periplasmic protein LptC [Candidatus Contendobacter odensis]MBK8534029.1 LPS export ABC transporter periplasmic protein LptC [Candidatus Competibacteraceae bacterium]MBK8754970.1 LPS export ABC transporter periplasmic protein LptC [Candidatus Competibacteraceae bacterium]
MVANGEVTIRGILYLSGLALLAGLSYGLLWLVESSLREPDPAESQAPVLTIERFRAVRMNIAGMKEYVVEAPRLQQLPGQSGTRIEQPALDWYQPDGQTREWRLQAEQAWGAADQQTLRLEGAVTMVRTAASGKLPMTVITRDILIRPAEHYAETAAPVQVVTPGGELRAVGMRAWLNQQRLELLSEVRGFYESPKR